MDNDDNKNLLVSESDDEVESFNISEEKDDSTKYEEQREYYQEDQLNDYSSYNLSELGDEFATGQNINDQDDMTVENNITSDNDEETEQPNEVRYYQNEMYNR